MYQSSCIQVTHTVKALLNWPLLLHTNISLLGGRGWTSFINDLERYPHCDWLKISYSANKVTFCKHASRPVQPAENSCFLFGNTALQPAGPAFSVIQRGIYLVLHNGMLVARK